MNGQQLIPIRFFFVVNEAGRQTMRGQRARIAAATDRGIDLTLERNAYSLLAGCHFALHINCDEFRLRNSFKLGQIGVTFCGKKMNIASAIEHALLLLARSRNAVK